MKYFTQTQKPHCMRRSSKIIITCIASLTIFSATLIAQDGAALFKQTCAACHSIGKGKLVGPDLKDVSQRRSESWLLSFIKSPQGMINSDPDAKALAAEYPVVMPDQNFSDAEIKSLIAYVTEMSSGAVAVVDTTPVAPVRSTDDATAAEIELGKNLFTGVASFANGGSSCISCHNVNYTDVIPGGLLAKDLTESHTRNGGDIGMMGLLGSPPFPAMQVAFADRKLTDEEIYALTAFLNKVNKDTALRQADQGDPLLYGGVPAVAALFMVFFLMYFNRKKSTVKQAIYARQIKSK